MCPGSARYMYTDCPSPGLYPGHTSTVRTGLKPCHENGLRNFRPVWEQPDLSNQLLEHESSGWYNTQAPIDKDADQSALMNSLVWAFVVCIDQHRSPSWFLSCCNSMLTRPCNLDHFKAHFYIRKPWFARIYIILLNLTLIFLFSTFFTSPYFRLIFLCMSRHCIFHIDVKNQSRRSTVR